MNLLRGVTVALAVIAMAIALVIVFIVGASVVVDTSPSGESPEGDDNSIPVPEENIWESSTLTVAVDDGSAEANATAIVSDALEWWEGNASRHAEYPIRFDLVDNQSTADISIDFVADVSDCGGVSTAVGCAKLSERSDRSASLYIESGYVDSQLRSTTKHELGHALGLDHGEGPEWMGENMGPKLYRHTLIEVRMSAIEADSEIIDQADEAASTVQTHLSEEFGHDVNIEIDRVGTFTGEFTTLSRLEYDVTSDRDICDGEPTCIGSGVAGQGIHINTARIAPDTHEYVLGTYLSQFYNLTPQEMPSEYQSGP